MKWLKCLLFLVVTILYCMPVADATICQPFSRFKMDCNNCFCSADGTRFSCSRKICRGRGRPDFNFLNDETDDDYMQPKESPKQNMIPYINDEIPSSREEWDDQPADGFNGNDYILTGNNEDPRFVQPIQEVNLDDQEEAEEIGALPDDYRFKRDILI